MIKKLADLDLDGKTVFIRVDFNVPIDQGKISEPHRIDSALPTIRYILQRAKKTVIASHLGRPDGKVVSKYSLRPVQEYLARVLGQSGRTGARLCRRRRGADGRRREIFHRFARKSALP